MTIDELMQHAKETGNEDYLNEIVSYYSKRYNITDTTKEETKMKYIARITDDYLFFCYYKMGEE